MAFTNEQVAAYIRDNNLDAAGAQAAANQFGVSSDQLAAAQGLLNNQTGITSLAGANTTVANPVISNEINQAYQNLFGRAADEAGAQYWAGTGLTGDALTQAMIGGARGSDIGTYYKTGDLDISPEITTSDIRNYVTQNINDPFAIYSAAQKYNVDPNTIAAVTGMNAQDLTSKFGLGQKVAQEYQDIGRGFAGEEAIDPTGFNYWYNQLQSGAIKPEDFEIGRAHV